jgi:hypothetical protein
MGEARLQLVQEPLAHGWQGGKGKGRGGEFSWSWEEKREAPRGERGNGPLKFPGDLEKRQRGGKVSLEVCKVSQRLKGGLAEAFPKKTEAFKVFGRGERRVNPRDEFLNFLADTQEIKDFLANRESCPTRPKQ